MNRITLIGNLCHSPEMRTTNSGKDVCNLSVAVNRRFKGPDGAQQTDFFNVQVWGNQAAACAQFLEKGRKVAITGSMQSRQYEGRDGTKKTAWDVVADEVEFLTPRGEATAEAPSAPPAGKRRVPMSNTNGFDPASAGFTTVADDDELPF